MIETCERSWAARHARWFVVLNELCSNFITIFLNVIPQTWFASNFLSNVNLFSLNLDVDVEGAGRRLVRHWTACPGSDALNIRRWIRPSLTLLSLKFFKDLGKRECQFRKVEIEEPENNSLPPQGHLPF